MSPDGPKALDRPITDRRTAVRRRSRLLGAALTATLAFQIVDVAAVPPASVEAATVTYTGATGAEHISVIGDSVMAAIRWYGTWQPLRRFNYTYDAESCRRTTTWSCRGREGYTPDTTLNAMRRLSGRLGKVLVIGTGYDDPGSTFASSVDAVMSEAAAQGIPVVLWATMRTDGVSYIGPHYAANAATYRANNQILYAKQAQYGGRLVVADWAGYSAGRSDWVTWDGIHLTPSGATAMAQFIADQSAAALRRISVPSAPALTAAALGPSQVRLTWTRPTSAGASSIARYGYLVSSDGGVTWRGGPTVAASARSVVVSGLTSGVTYRFRLAARNGLGWGAWSNTVTVTPRVVTPSAPTLRASVIGSGQIRLTWSAPTWTGGAPIVRYGYVLSSNGGASWRGGPTVAASARSAVVTGLTSGVAYRFRLAARNSMGWGVWSNTVTVTPRVVAPPAPTLRASAAGPGQVRLTWSPPTWTGGAPIVRYGYQLSSDGGTSWRGGPTVDGSARSMVVSGLTNGVTYRFRLAARNSMGWGALSNTVTVTPTAGLATTLSVPDASVVAEPATPSTTAVSTTTSMAPTTTEPEPPESSESVGTPPATVDASIGDLVWLDADGDGMQDVGETGLEGVEVRLIGADDTVLVDAFTDGYGRYQLGPQPSGSYSLEVVVPGGYAPTAVDVGPDDAVDSDADPADVIVGPLETTVRVAIDLVSDNVDLDIGLVAVPVVPSTESTTTAVPTTEAPTTEAPTTEAPPTEAPTTTGPPTTAAPTTTVDLPDPTEPVTVPTTESPTTTAAAGAVTTTSAPAG